MLSETDDVQIMALFRQSRGREKAFGLVVRKFSRPLYCFIRRMVAGHHDTDDILQNTFIKAWDGLDKLKEDSALTSWIYRIATNETMSFLKEKARLAQVPLDDLDLADTETDGIRSEEETERINSLTLQAIRSLPKMQQMVFSMKHFDGLKYREISEILGTSEGALKASYHIAVEKIRLYVNKTAETI